MSLKTKVLSVAKLKLADLEKKERVTLERKGRLQDGKTVFTDLVQEYRANLETSERTKEIKPNTKTYYSERSMPCWILVSPK